MRSFSLVIPNVATRFRQRRAERTLAGENDVSANIPDDRIDEVIARATEELTALAAARPHTPVVSTDGDVESTYVRDAKSSGDPAAEQGYEQLQAGGNRTITVVPPSGESPKETDPRMASASR